MINYYTSLMSLFYSNFHSGTSTTSLISKWTYPNISKSECLRRKDGRLRSRDECLRRKDGRLRSRSKTHQTSNDDNDGSYNSNGRIRSPSGGCGIGALLAVVLIKNRLDKR